MEHLLLKTKLNMPVTQGNFVVRQRLIDQLNDDLLQAEGFTRKLTLVSAPAGFGKTTLVALWLAGVQYRAVWLALDQGDNDPARFMTGLLAALGQVHPSIGSATQAMLQSPQPPPAETLITTLINDLAIVPYPFILGLDDYHIIQNPLVHRMVGFLLENQPSQMHLVILTREDPLLPISRLRSRRQLYEVRQANLSFTFGETAEFFRQIIGLDLAQADIEALWRRSEGWVVGLQLAALSMQGCSDLHEFVESFTGSNRYVLDYLFEEVFSRQSSDTRDFLIKTSILDRLSGRLCDAVAGRIGSQNLLEALERSNLFIVPLDQSREWFRYHHLFGDLLHHRLHLQGDTLEAHLHQRASEWFEQHDFQTEAVQHALAARDWERAAALIHNLSATMLKHGEVVTLLAWFKRFPEPFIRADPALCLDYSWPLVLSGQSETAESLLAHAEQLAAGNRPLLGAIATAQAYLARGRGDMPRTIELSQRALSLLPETDLASRAILALNLGIAFWHTGQMGEATHALVEAQHAAQESGNFYAQLTGAVFLSRVMAVRGKLRQAAKTSQQAVQQGAKAPILALAQLDLGTLHYEWNDLQASREHCLQGIAISEYSNNVEFQVAGYMLLARLEGALGNRKAAHEALYKAQELVQAGKVPAPTRARYLACQVEIALAQGDVEEAQSRAEQMSLDVDAHPFYRFLGLAGERLLIAQARNAEAAHRLAAKFEVADRAGWAYGAIAVRVLQSLAAGNKETGSEFLAEALKRAQPEGFIRTFADAGESLVPLLQEVVRRGIHPEYIGQILAVMGKQPPREVKLPAPGGWLVVEPLSERELEVLRLVAAGLSNREIAATLYLSPGTVKTHVHNIYGKLGVKNRTQAVTRAKELGLI